MSEALWKDRLDQALHRAGPGALAIVSPVLKGAMRELSVSAAHRDDDDLGWFVFSTATPFVVVAADGHPIWWNDIEGCVSEVLIDRNKATTPNKEGAE